MWREGVSAASLHRGEKEGRPAWTDVVGVVGSTDGCGDKVGLAARLGRRRDMVADVAESAVGLPQLLLQLG